jgi:hypothetical protein
VGSPWSFKAQGERQPQAAQYALQTETTLRSVQERQASPIQLLVEVQRENSSQGTKVDRLISDVEKVDRKIHELQTSFTWVKGFAAAAMILIPICAGIIWWLIGDELKQIRVQLQNRAQAPISSQAPAEPIH